MARRSAPSRTGKRRLSLNISNSVNDQLESLRDRSDADSLTEVIRRALAVYDHLWSESVENDAELVLRFPDGSEKCLILK